MTVFGVVFFSGVINAHPITNHLNCAQVCVCVLNNMWNNLQGSQTKNLGALNQHYHPRHFCLYIFKRNLVSPGKAWNPQKGMVCKRIWTEYLAISILKGCSKMFKKQGYSETLKQKLYYPKQKLYICFFWCWFVYIYITSLLPNTWQLK